MGQKHVLHARARQSVLSTTRRRTDRRRQSDPARWNKSLAAEHFENVYAVKIPIPSNLIVEVEEDEGILIITTNSGDTFELNEEAFTALTGREWADCTD